MTGVSASQKQEPLNWRGSTTEDEKWSEHFHIYAGDSATPLQEQLKEITMTTESNLRLILFNKVYFVLRCAATKSWAPFLCSWRICSFPKTKKRL